MRQLKLAAAKLKPAGGFAQIVHLGLVLLLPIAVFVFVRMHFVQLALAIILLSKWRMFAVRPRYWPANLRANAVDIIVGVSILVLMVHSGTETWQLILAALYAVWLIAIKPATNTLMVSVQAMVGMLLGLLALFLGWTSAPLYGLVVTAGITCYLVARHFFESFDEGYSKLLAYLWGYFGAALTWLLGHWLLVYGVVAQPALLLLVIGYGLAALYYLDHNDKLSTLLKRQFIFIMVAIVVVVLVFSNWGDKIV